MGKVLSVPVVNFDFCQCGDIFLASPFCTKCGVANPHFSKVEFSRAHGHDIEQDLLECRSGHVQSREDTKEDPELYRRYPYCGVCGERVYG